MGVIYSQMGVVRHKVKGKVKVEKNLPIATKVDSSKNFVASYIFFQFKIAQEMLL